MFELKNATIKSVKNIVFRDRYGLRYRVADKINGHLPYALYVPGKGYVSMEDGLVYTPNGGKSALKSIIESGLLEAPEFVNPVS